MRILPFLLAAGGCWAGPYLPQVAQTIPADGCRIKLEWISAPAGTIAAPQSISGTLEMAEGNRFRFHSAELVVVSDGTTLRQWNAATNQVIVRKASLVGASDLPTGLLRSALAGSETASSLEKLDGKMVRRLSLDVSRPPLSQYARATLWARESDHQPLRLEVDDAEGGRTTWKLLSLSRWKPSAKDFDYVPPAGAEVVDSR
jgi:outer membrane lipoprotein-sorting protein